MRYLDRFFTLDRRLLLLVEGEWPLPPEEAKQTAVRLAAGLGVPEWHISRAINLRDSPDCPVRIRVTGP
jgi:hypothetical protein